jgi:biotin carboxyl carrier protein
MALGNVPRCQHIKMNGVQCGSPALYRRRQCFFHERAREQHDRIVKDQLKQARFVMPVLEDANAVQMALMQVMQLLAWGEMDRKVAGLLLYGLQTASANLRHMDVEPEPTEVVINRDEVQQTDIGGPQWDPADFDLDEDEEQDSADEGVAAAGVPAITEVVVKDPAAPVAAAAQETVDSPAAESNGAGNHAVPSLDEVRKRIRGMVYNYIVETGRIPREVSG